MRLHVAGNRVSATDTQTSIDGPAGVPFASQADTANTGRLPSTKSHCSRLEVRAWQAFASAGGGIRRSVPRSPKQIQ
jgi:hypothetical protein